MPARMPPRRPRRPATRSTRCTRLGAWPSLPGGGHSSLFDHPDLPMLSRSPLLSWAFVLPALIIVGVLMYYPMIGTVVESFYSSSFINPVPQFVGLQVYQEIVGDGAFGQVVFNSIVWIV